MLKTLNKYFPILESLDKYNKDRFVRDLIAGLTVGVIFIPQGMAYAMLAGIPPIYGLYAGLFPLLIYAFLGSSRLLSIGPVAVSALLILAGIGQIAEPFSSDYIAYVILTGFLIGLVQLFVGIFRLGFIVNFLSHPVIAGFSSAAALIIIISQFRDIFGFQIEGSTSAEKVLYVIQNLDQTHWLTLIICLGSLALLVILRILNKKLPGALLVAGLATIITWYFQLTQYDVSIIGEIPKGLPSFLFPQVNSSSVKAVLPTVITVAIIGTVECISISKVLESKNRNHVVKANTELIALGFSKIIGSLFQAMPTSGSFSRSAVNNDSAGHSQISSIVTVVLLALTLLFLTPLFYYTPTAVLAAIILYSAKGLFEYEEAKYLFKVHRSDFWMLIATFLITLILGIEEGVFSGVLLSLATILYRSTQPHVAELGNISNTEYYRNIDRYESSTSDKIIILRFDDQLYFGNSQYFKEYIRDTIKDRIGKATHLLLDCSNIHAMDSSGAHALHDIEAYLYEKGIEIHLAGANGPLRDMLHKCGLMNEPHKHHMNVHAGVLAIKGLASDREQQKATQRNI